MNSLVARRSALPLRSITRPMLDFPTSTLLRTACSFQFARGEDMQQLARDAEALVQRGWTRDGDGMGVVKTFHFKSYFKAIAFVNTVAAESASKKHHPTMTVRIGSVDVHWTTHNPRGFTRQDVMMAQYCDQGAGLLAVDSQGIKCGT